MSSTALIRWFFAFYPEYVKEDLPFAREELFRDRYISKLKKLILGFNHTEQNTLTHALAVLARLIGHGGPIVTMQKYIHCAHWLFYLMSKNSKEIKVEITSGQAQELLQMSYPTLPSEFNGRGKKLVTFGDILREQAMRLE